MSGDRGRIVKLILDSPSLAALALLLASIWVAMTFWMPPRPPLTAEQVAAREQAAQKEITRKVFEEQNQQILDDCMNLPTSSEQEMKCAQVPEDELFKVCKKLVDKVGDKPMSEISYNDNRRLGICRKRLTYQ